VKDKPVERDVDRMRELLARTPPADPALAGRADAVVRRARASRRRRGVIGGIAVAVFAAAVIVTPHFLKTSPTTNEATDPSNGATLVDQADDDLLANPCSTDDPIDGPTDTIPAAVAFLRLCTTDYPGSEPATWAPPLDALVQTDLFFQRMAAEQAARPDRCATANPVPDPLQFVFVTLDGKKGVASALNTCEDVSVSGTAYPVTAVLSAYFGALDAQREERRPPADIDASCPPEPAPDSWTWPLEPDTRMSGRFLPSAVSGVVCYMVDPMGGREYADDQGELSATQLAVVVDDMAARKTAEPTSDGGCTDSGPTRIVVLVDEWGDRQSWVDAVCSGEFTGAGQYWIPSASAEDVITSALGGGID